MLAGGGAHAAVLAPASVSVGTDHSCALMTDGTVFCWGDSAFGQVGDGTTDRHLSPVQISGLSGVSAVTAGVQTSCALLSDQTITCWGRNDRAQTGNQRQDQALSPVATLDITAATAVSSGLDHTCALLSDATVKCWGSNSYAQLGNASNGSFRPVSVSISDQDGVRTLTGVTAIASGFYHSCALVRGGTVWCWGWNPFGQVGNGTTNNAQYAVAVSGLSGVLAISAGDFHNCAVLTVGTVKCWGANFNGQLGSVTSPDTAKSLIPVAVPSLSGVAAISAGGYQTCALLTGKTVSCWGDNTVGQLGDGTTVSSLAPVAVSGLSNVALLSVSNTSACAVLMDGTLKCWGGNESGQIGDGTTKQRSPPVYTVFPQSISWSQTLSGGVGDSVALTATASSGLSVTYAGTADICTISGSTLTLVATGTCIVTAAQAGTSNYSAADSVSLSFDVTKGTQTISWSQSLSGAVGGTVSLGATATSGLALTYASDTTGVCTVSGTTLSLVSAGTCSITASQAGSDSYFATSLTRSFTVAKGSQSISWSQSLSGAVTGSLSLAASTSSGLAVSFAGTSGVCTASGSTLSLVAQGICTVTVTQAGNDNYLTATSVQKTFTVTAAIAVSPSSLSFASRPINTTSSAQTIAVSNGGGASFQITGITLSGTDAAAFTASNGCSTVAAGASCTISLTFKPTTTGAKAATLAIASTAIGTPSVSVSLSGTGSAAAPIIGLSASSFSFGNQFVGTASAGRTLTISNAGSASLAISSSVLSGTNAAAFTKTGTCTSVAAGASCALTLAFAPSATGAASATLTINSNASGSAATTVALTGAGIVTTLSSLAGTIDGPGFANGTGSAARFNMPSGIALDASGNLYVTDTDNNLVRKVTTAGVVTTLAGQVRTPGATNATGTSALFKAPTGIAITSSNLLVADSGNHMIRKLTTAGVATTLAGTAGSSGTTDATGTAARFNLPQGIAVDSAGIAFVTDTGNSTIRKITTAGVVTTFAGSAGLQGGTNDTGSLARFASPLGITRDASNVLYVTDSTGQTLRKITTAGVVSTLAGAHGLSGSTNDTGALARFSAPSGAVVDSTGALFVTDAANGTIRKVTSGGAVTTFAGTAGAQGSVNGTGAGAMFYKPVGLARDASNTLYVADPVAHVIRKITSTGATTTLAGYPATVGAANDTGSLASFRDPSAMVADGAGNLFIADTGNHSIRKVTPAGVVTTFAGTALISGATNGTGADARFNGPRGLAIDGSGTLYVADTGNHAIRMITSAGVVTTLAGSAGTVGSTDATGALARFRGPAALAVDSAGSTLYVADTGNYTLRKITVATGAVSTLAGSAGLAGTTEGTGTAARFGLVQGLGLDTTGTTLYVADTSNNTIRKVVISTGLTSTFAGTAGSRGTLAGTGTAARFSSPSALMVDSANTLYVGDAGSCTLRKITSAAVVTTPVGSAGTCLFAAANAPSTISVPMGLAKVGTSLFVTLGNGVAKVANIP